MLGLLSDLDQSACSKQDFSIFGPLWPFFRSASTVGEVLHDLAEFFPVHTQGALVAVKKTPHGF
jgi:hypothetical protein